MLLLDTSALLWVLVDSPRLGRASRARIAAASRVHASAVSVVELVVKGMLGRIELPPDLPDAIRAQSVVELPLGFDDAAAIRDFPELVGHDPFDRMLVAQAHAQGLTLLTSDRVLLGLDRHFILDATR
ncbi:PIN domain nuclease, a component of toxin-antitoxin system (PIN domain) [Jatrophihabitans endophyticus]|uniref:PIN domain nuclease, a component of toxin-antitoxin system (PIN domain) n=1 Tax=Jatrophihabitans endophyticus TaxID=1206085 RepID=A0A1M5TBA4_9ACTN|nr:type II toxin-antitoxin system VapC family toxin [Jatrophihabitans endophyticus]SHH48085.1 PIN domain nuclease, a component of toxin-antitoxin system (PIN domain) [Jatrophihabitans endophyticus]